VSQSSTERRPRAGASEIVPALGLVALGIYMLVSSRSIAIPAGEHSIGPRFFPYVVGGLLVVVGLWLAIAVWRGDRAEPEGSEDVAEDASTDWRTVAVIVAVLVAYVALINPLGYLIATVGLFAGVAWSLGARGWRGLVIFSILVPFATYMLFTRALGVYLPNGLLESVI
jgi:putative tricarboxylic transport membrane protein